MYKTDAIRGIAIVLIVFFHIQFFIPQWPAWSFYCAMLGVGLFFFISGYALQLTYPTRINDIAAFGKKRLSRIYPLFTVAFIVGYLQDPHYYLQCPWYEILGYYLNVNNILEPRFDLTLDAYWFVSAILFFYLLFIIINRHPIGLPMAFIIIFGLRQIFDIIPTRMLAYFVVFAVGILFARFDLLEKKKYAPMAFVLIPPLFIISYYKYGFYFLDDMPPTTPYILAIIQIVLIVFVLYAIQIPPTINDILCKIGFASLAIYLFHMSVFFHLPKEYYLMGLPLSLLVGYYIQKLEDMAKNHHI